MKVSDVMSKQVEYVSADAKVEAVARLIFGRSINGLPVCKGKKVVGFITERDILSKFYPSLHEYVENPLGEGDFEGMEEKVSEILTLTADKIMGSNPVIVTGNTPLLRAQSLMLINKVGRLPVVDEEGNLVGILSKGDIFRTLVGQKLPLEEDESFHDWLARHYDLIIDQKKRLTKEIPDIVRMFRQLNVKNVIDVGSGPGGHSIMLAREGFETLGIDRSCRMIDVAQEKTKSLPTDARQRVRFIGGNYKKLDKLLDRKFDAAIFMGSALAHVENPQQILEEVNKVLNDKAIVICQVVNYDKLIRTYNGFYDFNIRKSPYSEEQYAFLRFYDPVIKGFLTQNLSVFIKVASKWVFRGMRSMRTYPITKEKITKFLKKIKFLDIKYYGEDKGFFYDYLFRKPFKPTQSDVLVVVAKRYL